MTTKPQKILCVDDDSDACDLMTVLLGQEGYEVSTADGANEAIKLARQGGFDLIILDNWLGGESGITLCRDIRLFDSTTPIIFHSAAASETDIQEAMQAGAQEYMIKPVDLMTLLQTVAGVIRGHNAPGPQGTEAIPGK